MFGWGALGGAIVAIILYVVPELARDLVSTRTTYLTSRKVKIMFVMVVLLAAVAGVVALAAPHVATRGQAITAGITIQAALRGIFGAIQQGIRPDQGSVETGVPAAGEAVAALPSRQGG